jgi:hypothetical protein
MGPPRARTFRLRDSRDRTGEVNIHSWSKDRILIIPNPHRSEIGVDLLMRIPRQAGITREEWSRIAPSPGYDPVLL